MVMLAPAPYYDNVALLLPMSGLNNSTGFQNYSRNPKTVLVSGNAKTVTSQADPFGNYTGVAYFDGAGDYLYVPDVAELNFGTGDFEIEVFVYRANAPSGAVDMLFHQLKTVGFNIEWNPGNRLGLWLHGPSTYNQGANSFILGAYNHVVINRIGGVFRGFLNGVLQFTRTQNVTLNGGVFYIGFDVTTAGRDFGPGYMSMLQVIKGVARYVEDFTPPASSLVEIIPGGFIAVDVFSPLQPLTGNVTKAVGGPADIVLIRDWTTKMRITEATPDANGDWSAEVPPGQYDITYLSAGCAPICHGPYTVDAP